MKRCVHRCFAGLAVAVLATIANPASAAVSDFLGKPIVEVHLQSDGGELRDPSLVEIVETRTGEPLTMLAVRETLAHLYGLGRYQDVQVDAQLRANGVALTYNLVPAQRVQRIVFSGNLGLPEDELRRIVTDRYGASPSLARASQVVGTLETLYRDHGYPRASIAPRTQPGRDPAFASLVLAIEPGPRAKIAAIDFQGPEGQARGGVLAKIDVAVGADYDGIALDAKLAKYADELRSQGYYEARATQLPRFVNDDREVNLVLSIDPGPRVEIAFEGDPLATRERDQLVPIAREHSVDEDLLEDSKFGIERHFRERGFCSPRADYQRREESGVLRIVFTVTRGPQCTLERESINGNAAIPFAELAPLMQSRPGQPFNENAAGADAIRIQNYYRQRGFAAVKVAPEIDRGATVNGVSAVRVTLQIAEGPKSVIQSVTFEGNAAISADALRQTISSAPGQPYFEPQITSDADALIDLYANRGYQEATVQPRPSLGADKSSVDLKFVVHEGPQILVDHILIVGNRRTRRDVIADEIQFKRGAPLSPQDEADTRARITGLGLFRRVDISYLQLPGDQNHRDVIITVEEAPVTTIDYGGGLEGGKRTIRAADASASEAFQLAPRGFFQITRRNLFGRDRTLNLFTRVSFTPANDEIGESGYGFNDYLTRLTYFERRLFGTGVDASISGGVEQARRSSFDFNRRGGSVTLARRLSRTLGVSARYALEKTQLLRVRSSDFFSQNDIDRLFPQVRLSAVSGSVIRDTRLPDSIDPSEGTLVAFDAELAPRALGSEVGFVKSFVQGFDYRRLGRSRVVGAFGARLGLATGFPREVVEPGQQTVTIVEDLPASERFYAGGDTTVRGFALDRLGPLDDKGFPVGGHASLIFNGELRIPVRGGLGAVTFLDVGNVFLHVNDIDFNKLRGSLGFGIRYKSPVGPIRVDLGFKMERKRLPPNGDLERPTALHISLGQAF